ncbi:endonuclease V [Candidatus Bipolaricaulota bacterium]|nr:endonuclease V [Candidatus Bipolaricaulota bacterium]
MDRFSVPDVEGELAELVRQIPRGRVTTYRALAEALGDPTAARFVGEWLMGPGAEGLPVHRVVHASGDVGRFAFGTWEEKANLLSAEGVQVVGRRVSPLPRYFFWDFKGSRPLAALRAEQEELSRKAIISPLPPVERVAGLDVAYRDGEAVAALVLCGKDGEALDFVTAEVPVRFPYIPTYLTWRELPCYLAAIRKAEEAGLRADVYLVDGNGILHPRRIGIATHLGVILDLPTVGVAKRRLCGEVNTEGMVVGEWRPVVLDGDTVGAAVRTGRNRTLFVSPGHRADLESSVELVLGLVREHTLPEPLRWAHELAGEAASLF